MSVYNLSSSDAYGHKGAFQIWSEDGYIGTYFYKYNTMLKTVLGYIQKLKSLDKNFEDWFLNEIESIYVTSMYRPHSGSSYHNSPHNAVDIVIYPWYLNLYLYIVIRKYFPKQNIFISSYNHHLHFDNRKKEYSGIEILKQKSTGKILLPKNSNNYIRYTPSKHYIDIYRGDNANTYQQWMFSYYEISKTPFFSSIEKFIKNNFFVLTAKEQKEKNLSAVIYSITGLIGISILFKQEKKNE